MLIRWTKRLARFVLRFFFRFETDGDLRETRGPYILCANHRSNWDALAMFTVSPEDTYIVGKKELSDLPIIGAFLRRVHLIPVDREANDIGALRSMLSVLKKGSVLGIFPEGHRYEDADFSHMKEGVAYLVQKAKVPVHCLYIDSDYRFRHRFHVTVRQPLAIEDLSAFSSRAQRKDMLRLIYETIYEPMREGEETYGHSDC